MITKGHDYYLPQKGLNVSIIIQIENLVKVTISFDIILYSMNNFVCF